MRNFKLKINCTILFGMKICIVYNVVKLSLNLVLRLLLKALGFLCIVFCRQIYVYM